MQPVTFGDYNPGWQDRDALTQTTANWMTSNLLCLNNSKTEFLLLGLQSQLNKIHNPTLHLNSGISLPLTAFAWNLGFISDSTLIRFLLYLGHVSIIFVISAESVQFSISVQHMP